MTDKNAAAAVEPLLPIELGPGKIKFAQGMKAGRWVFATGVMAPVLPTWKSTFKSFVVACLAANLNAIAQRG